MGDILQNVFGGQSDNPFQPPAPGLQEILFRTVAGSLPPPGQLRVPGTVGGRILGGGARVIGSLAGVIGSELEKQRLDPLKRALIAGQAGVEAAKNIKVPVPGVPEQLPDYPDIPPSFARDLETAYGGEPSRIASIPEIPPTTRPPRTFAELMANAPQEKVPGLLAASKLFPEDVLFAKPQFHAVSPGQTIVDLANQQVVFSLARPRLSAELMQAVSSGDVENAIPLMDKLPYEEQQKVLSMLEQVNNRIENRALRKQNAEALDSYRQESLASRNQAAAENRALRRDLAEEKSVPRDVVYVDAQGQEHQDIHTVAQERQFLSQGGMALKGQKAKEYRVQTIGDDHYNWELDVLERITAKIPPGTRPATWLKTKLRNLSNDPDIVAWDQTLGFFSASAMQQVATSGMSQGSRALAGLMFAREALPHSGDDTPTFLTKIDALADRELKAAKSSGFPADRALATKERVRQLRERFGIIRPSNVPSLPVDFSMTLNAPLRKGEIRVIEKSTGNPGRLPESEFDPNLYERLQ